MTVEALEVRDFRNLALQKIEIDKKCTLFYGNNGQGKTNILEAIWLLSCGKSLRGAPDREMIAFGKENAAVKLYCEDDVRKIPFEARLYSEKRKEIFISNEKITRNVDLLGNLLTVLFVPDNLNMVKGSPENRRKFLDVSLCQQSRGYFNALKDYNKLLDGRNTLLKQIARREQPEEVLDVWDSALAERGAKIAIKRNEYVERLSPIAYYDHKELSENKEEMSLLYESFLNELYDEDEAEAEFLKKLQKMREEDIWNGNTSVGCHRDDLEIMLNDLSLKKYGSEGQKRSAVITLKLAEGAIIEDVMGVRPVFLLDDVLSELDERRREYIVSSIKDFQVIITDCQSSMNKNICRYKVEKGRVYGE